MQLLDSHHEALNATFAGLARLICQFFCILSPSIKDGIEFSHLVSVADFLEEEFDVLSGASLEEVV